MWFCNSKLLELGGRVGGHYVNLHLNDGSKELEFLNITQIVGPRVSLHPSFGISLRQIGKRITGSLEIFGGPETTLVLSGTNTKIGDVILKRGVLVVKNREVSDLVVENSGWPLRPLAPGEEDVDQSIAIRGYAIEKIITFLNS